MHAESIVVWFGPPARLPASYLPPPYGVCLDVIDTAVWRSKSGIRCSREPLKRWAVERTAAMQGVTCAADFGHDNLAWSRMRPLPRRARMMAATFGGALFGATVAALFGMADFSPAPNVTTARHAPVAERVFTSAGGELAGAVPTMASQSRVVGEIAKAQATEQSAPIGKRTLGERAALTDEAVPARAGPSPALRQKTVMGIGMRETARKIRVTLPIHATPDEQAAFGASAATWQEDCADDWPCGDSLKSMRIELENWKAAQQHRPAQDLEDTSVRLRDHIRLTDG